MSCLYCIVLYCMLVLCAVSTLANMLATRVIIYTKTDVVHSLCFSSSKCINVSATKISCFSKQQTKYSNKLNSSHRSPQWLINWSRRWFLKTFCLKSLLTRQILKDTVTEKMVKRRRRKKKEKKSVEQVKKKEIQKLESLTFESTFEEIKNNYPLASHWRSRL